MYINNLSLKNFETQTKVSAKQLSWYDTLVLMNVKIIHKPGCGNMVSDALSRHEEFQAMDKAQTLWKMYKGEGNLQRKINEKHTLQRQGAQGDEVGGQIVHV